MNSLTKQQREELYRLADLVGARGLAGDSWEDVLEQLVNFVDALADARVVQFAQGALLAPDVEAHLRNTVEQYALLGHAVHPTGDPDPICDECSKPLSMHGSSKRFGAFKLCPWQNPAHNATMFTVKERCANCGSVDHANHEHVEGIGWICYGEPTVESE